MKTFPCFATNVAGLVTENPTIQKAWQNQQPRHLKSLTHMSKPLHRLN